MSRIDSVCKAMLINYLTSEEKTTEQLISDVQVELGKFFNSLEEATIPTKGSKVQKLNKTLSGTTRVSR